MRGHVEGGMDGVAGARMVQREFQQRLGRQACPGEAEPDPRRGQVPQIPRSNGATAPVSSFVITRQGPTPRAAASNSSRRYADRPRPRAQT